MNIETITDSSVAVSFAKNELGQNISDCQARELVSGILTMRGHTPWEDMEVDLFRMKGRVLLIARRGPGIHIWRFEGLEPLLTAVLSSPELPESDLICADGRWYMSVAGEIPPAFREFGNPESGGADLRSFLVEHGSLLLEGNASGVLREKFADNR